MLVTESKSVAPSERKRTHFDTTPTSSYFDWAMQARHSFQCKNLKRGFPGRLPELSRALKALSSLQSKSIFGAFHWALSSLQSKRSTSKWRWRIARATSSWALLEAIKLTGYCSSSSSNSSASSPSSPVSSFYFGDSFLNTLLMGMEAGHQSSTTG